MIYENQLRAMGLIDPNGSENSKKIREAYEKAHDIRKFEIELYWKRSSYLWAIQAAAFAGVAVILASTESITWVCKEPKTPECIAQQLRAVSIASIWAFGLFSSYIWVLLLKGSKFWQNNWERHVDALEQFCSGDLYKTYRVKEFKAPYSVSKLNELMAYFSVLVWILVGLVSVFIFVETKDWPIWVIPVVSLVLFFACYFDACLRMSQFGRVVGSDTGQKGEAYLIVSRGIQKEK